MIVILGNLLFLVMLIQKVHGRCEEGVGRQEIALAFITLQKLHRQEGLARERPASDAQEKRFEVYGRRQ